MPDKTPKKMDEIVALLRSNYKGEKTDLTSILDHLTNLELNISYLKRQHQKQEFDFHTIFEIVTQVTARTLDVDKMQDYVIHTIMGQFLVQKVFIFRQQAFESQEINLVASSGGEPFASALDLRSEICRKLTQAKRALTTAEVEDELVGCPEMDLLKKNGIEVVVPLIRTDSSLTARLVGAMCLGKRWSQLPFSDSDLNFLFMLGNMIAIVYNNEEFYRRSIRDDLTQVINRGHFDALLLQEISRVNRYGGRLALVLLDIDHFKNFNDAYGHQTGDQVLIEIAQVLQREVRNNDTVARYGGEEFAIILLGNGRSDALMVTERLRYSVETHPIKSYSGEILSVSASFGVACYPDDAHDKKSLVRQADMALYRAKAAGRNRVVMSGTSEPENPTV